MHALVVFGNIKAWQFVKVMHVNEDKAELGL